MCGTHSDPNLENVFISQTLCLLHKHYKDIYIAILLFVYLFKRMINMLFQLLCSPIILLLYLRGLYYREAQVFYKPKLKFI